MIHNPKNSGESLEHGVAIVDASLEQGDSLSTCGLYTAYLNKKNLENGLFVAWEVGWE